MIKPGDIVHHQTRDTSFGRGRVLQVNRESHTALVEWDSHVVARTTGNLTQQQSHVDLANLTILE